MQCAWQMHPALWENLMGKAWAYACTGARNFTCDQHAMIVRHAC